MLFNKTQKLFYIIGLVTLLASCNNSEEVIKNNYYLSLSGESENWEVDSYEVMINPDTFNAGNGKLTMKNDKEVTSNFFSIRVHAVINGRDEVVQGKSVTVTGSESNIAKSTTGAIEGGTYFKENGDPITLKDVRDIYMIIQWQNGNKDMEERVDLYNQGEKFSF